MNLGGLIMAYIIGVDRNQIRMITTSLDALIDENNSVRVIDASYFPVVDTAAFAPGSVAGI